MSCFRRFASIASRELRSKSRADAYSKVSLSYEDIQSSSFSTKNHVLDKQESNRINSLPEKQLSTVARGNLYEEATKSFLSQPPFKVSGLIKVGGADDKGVDLRGWIITTNDTSTSTSTLPLSASGSPSSWSSSSPSNSASPSGSNLKTALPSTSSLPSSFSLSSSPSGPPPKVSNRPPRWGVIVQCKAESKPLGPSHIRELEGVLANESPVRLDSRNIPGRHLALETEAAHSLTGSSKSESNQVLPPWSLRASSQTLSSSSAPSLSTTSFSTSQPSTVGILVSEGGFSTKARIRARSSKWPIGLLHLSKQVESSNSSVTTNGNSMIGSNTTKEIPANDDLPNTSIDEQIVDDFSESRRTTAKSLSSVNQQAMLSQQWNEPRLSSSPSNDGETKADSPYRATSLLWNETWLNLVGRNIYCQTSD